MISFREIGHLGRIGNQLFQFASTLGIARLKGTDPVFPSENSHTTKETGPVDRSTGNRLGTKLDIPEGFTVDPSFFIKGSEIKTTQRYVESNFVYDRNIELIPDNVDLFGYFQSEKYFKHVEDEVRRNLIFRDIYSSYADEFLRNLNQGIHGSEKISVHIRRGDYLSLPGHHPVCSLEYYHEAMNLFVPDSTFIVFSDDIKWAKDNIKGQSVIFVEDGDQFKEMCLMSKCDHHIIANSSYSWWGAWLNNKKDKKIVSPSRWFGELMEKDPRDIYCEGWIKI